MQGQGGGGRIPSWRRMTAMTGLGPRDISLAGELAQELGTLIFGRAASLQPVLERVQAELELEIVVLYSARRGEHTLEVDRWHQAGGRASLRPVLAEALACSEPTPVLFYDLLQPIAAHRNRLVEATAWIDRKRPGTWQRSRLCRDFMAPRQLDRHQQPRVLVCEGASLLAWFGALHPVPLTVRQKQLLTSLIAPLQQRLSAERTLESSSRTQRALEVALEHIGAPAFVIGAHGAIHDANRVGRALLAERRGDVTGALRDATCARPTTLKIELHALRTAGVADAHLAIVRAGSLETRLVACVRTCIRQWQLTPRQGAVLDLVTRGGSNASIADALRCGERAVELHMTALFDRLGVESRAALVSRVLTIDP